MVYRLQGMPQQAEATLGAALRTHERLVRDHPDVPDFQAELARTHSDLGGLHHNVGQDEQAESDLQRALPILEKLAREHPDVPEYAWGLAYGYEVLGMAANAQDKTDLALASCDKAVAILETLVEKESRNQRWRIDLWDNRLLRAAIWAQRGDHARAVQEVEALAATRELSENNLYNLACVYARAAAAAGKDEKLPAAERSRFQDRYATQAVDSLRQAVARGFRNLPGLQNDPDLEAVRGRPEFQKLVQELEEKVKKP
jgi:tetratricopeptide (TPR) repeat protein